MAPDLLEQAISSRRENAESSAETSRYESPLISPAVARAYGSESTPPPMIVATREKTAE